MNRTVTNVTRGLELQFREGLQPDGKWTYFRYYPEGDEIKTANAISYRDAANAKHPDRWRLLPVTTESGTEDVISNEEFSEDFYGEPLP